MSAVWIVPVARIVPVASLGMGGGSAGGIAWCDGWLHAFRRRLINQMMARGWTSAIFMLFAGATITFSWFCLLQRPSNTRAVSATLYSRVVEESTSLAAPQITANIAFFQERGLSWGVSRWCVLCTYRDERWLWSVRDVPYRAGEGKRLDGTSIDRASCIDRVFRAAYST